MTIPLQHDYNWSGRDDGPDAPRWHQVFGQSLPAAKPVEVKPVEDQPVEKPFVKKPLAEKQCEPVDKKKANVDKRAQSIIGFCCDLGVAHNQGRIGQAAAPNAIRKALSNFACLKPEHYDLTDWGNYYTQGLDLAIAQGEMAQHINSALKASSFCLVLGGGHETAWSSYSGLYAYLTDPLSLTKSASKPSIGIINLDAHFDLRSDDNGASSGTPFYQIAHHCQTHTIDFNYLVAGIAQPSNTQVLFDRAQKLGVKSILDTQLRTYNFQQQLSEIQAFVDRFEHIYLSIDLDAFSASIAPAVSAPASLGLSMEVGLEIIKLIKQSTKLRLADVVELNPSFDIDQRTATLAARLVYELI